MNMDKNKPSGEHIYDKDLLHLVRGTGIPLPEGFIDEVLEKTKVIDREFERDKAKERDEKEREKE
jgi:hypothetical protein